MQAFLVFVKFTVFVSVEQGDINKLCFCVSEKIYLGYTAATKSWYPKKKTVKSRAKKVKHNSLFFQKLLFPTFFFSPRGFLLRLYLTGGVVVRKCYFDVLLLFYFLSLGRTDRAEVEKNTKKVVFLARPPPSTSPPDLNAHRFGSAI